MNRLVYRIVLLALVLGVALWPRLTHRATAPLPGGAARAPAAVAAAPAPSAAPAARAFGAGVGFHSHERWIEHFRKHGAELGCASPEDYLRRAQALRDRPTGTDVLEAVRGDGVITRFDRASGLFVAFQDDGVLRTCFRPHDGESYFRRQLEREPR